MTSNICEEDKTRIRLTDEVFYKEEHAPDRDICTTSLASFLKQICEETDGGNSEIHVADVFSGSGIRALRLATVLHRLGLFNKRSITIDAVDVDDKACTCIEESIALNETVSTRVQCVKEDAKVYLENRCNTLGVLELDPFGSVESFLEPAIKSMRLYDDEKSGEPMSALLSFATFDTGDLVGATQGRDRSKKFGAYLPTGSTGTAAEECAIRIVLYKVADLAKVLRGGYIEPLGCYNFEFGFRFILRVVGGRPDAVPFYRLWHWCSTCQWAIGPTIDNDVCVQCRDVCCFLCKAQSTSLIGPLWAGQIYDQQFLQENLRGIKRHGGKIAREMIMFASKETNVTNNDCSLLLNVSCFVRAMNSETQTPVKQLRRNIFSSLKKNGYLVTTGSGLISCDTQSTLQSNCPAHSLLRIVKRQWRLLLGNSRVGSESAKSPDHHCKRNGKIYFLKTLNLQSKRYAIPVRCSSKKEENVRLPFDERTFSQCQSSTWLWSDRKDRTTHLMLCMIESSSKVVLSQECHALARMDNIPRVSVLHVAGFQKFNQSCPQEGQCLTEVHHLNFEALTKNGQQMLQIKIDELELSISFHANQIPEVRFTNLIFLESSLNGHQPINFFNCKGRLSASFENCCFQSHRTCLNICSKAEIAISKCVFEYNCAENQQPPPRKRARYSPSVETVGRHVLVTGNSSCFISACSFRKSCGPAVECRNGSYVIIHDSLIQEAQRAGVFVHRKGELHITETCINSSAWAGIEIRNGGFSSLRCCSIKDSGRGGVYCTDGGKIELQDTNVETSVLAGIHVVDGGTATLRGSIKFSGNQGHGIFVQGQDAVLSMVTSGSLDLSSNRESAIHVCTDACIKIETGTYLFCDEDNRDVESVQDKLKKVLTHNFCSCLLPDDNLLNSSSITLSTDATRE